MTTATVFYATATVALLLCAGYLIVTGPPERPLERREALVGLLVTWGLIGIALAATTGAAR